MGIKKFFIMSAMILIFSSFTFSVALADTVTTSNLESELRDVNNQISSNPNEVNLYIKRGEIYLRLYEIDGARYSNSPYEEDIKKAKADYEKALSINPNSADAYCGLGNVARAYRDFFASIKGTAFARWFLNSEDIEKSLESAKNDTFANYYKAMEINPNHTNCYISRAEFYEDIEMYSLAAEDYTKAISLDKNNFYLHLKRGENYLKIKEYNLADSDFTNAISILENYNGDEYYQPVRVRYSPRDIKYEKDQYCFYQARAYDDRGKIHLNLKDYQEAIDEFNQAIKLKPRYPYFHTDCALAYEGLKKYREALEQYNIVLKDFPKLKIAKEGKKRVEKLLKTHK